MQDQFKNHKSTKTFCSSSEVILLQLFGDICSELKGKRKFSLFMPNGKIAKHCPPVARRSYNTHHVACLTPARLLLGFYFI